MLAAPFIARGHANAAFSLATTLELEIYGVCTDAAEDARMQVWIGSCSEALLPHSIGSGKVNVSNVEVRPQNVLSRASSDHMSRFRSSVDPDGLFHAALGV